MDDMFKGVNAEQLEFVKDVAEQLEGKSGMDAIEIVMKNMMNMPKGEPLSREAKLLMIEEIKKGANPVQAKMLDELLELL